MTSCLLAIYVSLMNLLFIFRTYLSQWGSSIFKNFFMSCTYRKDINNLLLICFLISPLSFNFVHGIFLNLYKFEIFH